MNRFFTYEILKQECVGDSLGKHNYNILALDAAICNLSSKFLTTTNNNIPLLQTFNDLNQNISIYNNNLQQMQTTSDYDKVFNGLNLLSGYWLRQEITVEYEFNAVSSQNIPINMFLVTEDTETFVSELTSLTYNYITLNYPVSNFLNNALINVVTPIYAGEGNLTKVYSYQDANGQATVTNQLPVYSNLPSIYSSEEYRYVYGFFEKEDDNFAATPVIRFLKENDNWTFVNIVCAACLPTEQISVVTSSVVENAGSLRINRGNLMSSGPCSPISFDYLYRKNIYSYATATAAGRRPDKLGTLSLFFYNPQIASSSTIPYASVSPTINSDFHTVTLEWRGNSVNAYESSDTTRRLVNTWPVPYDNGDSIAFAFKKDDNAINYTACASKLIYPPD